MDWPDSRDLDDADDRGHFNIFGKKHNFAPPPLDAGFSPALFRGGPPSPGRLSLPFSPEVPRMQRAASHD